MNHLTIVHKTETYTLSPETGTNLLDIIRDLGISGFSAPCGGKGTCGKCRVILKDGELNPITDQELKLLDPPDIEGGTRLACKTLIPADSNLTIWVPDSQASRIQAYSSLAAAAKHPRFKLLKADLGTASIHNQQGRLERVLNQLEKIGVPAEQIAIPLSALQQLGIAQLNGSGTQTGAAKLQFLLDGDTLRSIQLEETTHCGCAVDIGTTTIVMHLINLLDGTILGTWSQLNEQKSFGADVISRIQYTMEAPENTGKLQKAISRQLDTGLRSLFTESGIPGCSLRAMTIAGNTTMLHLLTGCETAGIAASPFIPVFTEKLNFSGAELGFTSAPEAIVELLPSIAAYVGADISAGISVTNLPNREKPSLLIDIGTNGEMAVGDHQQVVCCSTAAGPAFEGANIRYGTGGITGAVDSVKLTDGKVEITTIGDAPAVGICGSGIIDAAAMLVASGAADYTGRMADPGDPDYPWIVDFQGSPALLIADAQQTLGASPIYFTQKDLREVQLAKAAIAGGIRTLLAEKDLSLDEIDEVFLAGGFGSYINPESAGIIGLLPGNLAKITTTVGNTAGEGAVRALLDRDEFARLRQIQQETTYIELSARADFQQYYIEEMYFGEI